MSKVLFTLLSAAMCFSPGYTTDADNSPLNQLANVIQFINTTELCDRICDANTWFDDYGSLNICFKTKIREGENADDLCKCMFNYINQNNWLVDADHQCIVECDDLSMVLIGPPNPDYNPNIPVIVRPLSTLAVVLKQFPKASLGGQTCKSTSDVLSDGLTRLVIKCKLACQVSPKKARKDILSYLNQNHWLDDTKNSCKSKGRCLTLEIVGK